MIFNILWLITQYIWLKEESQISLVFASPSFLTQVKSWGARLLQWGTLTGSASLDVEGDVDLDWM